MVSLAQLWLPILLSGVFVFIASSILHMLLKFWHMPDYHGFANEDEVRAAVRKGNPTPGMYMLPWCKMEEMKQPAAQARFTEGPVAFIILRASGMPNMGKSLGSWFVFCLIVALFAGYIAIHALPVAAPYLHVFQIVGTAAFMGFAFGALPMAIWWGQPWGAVAKDMIDGLIYASITAGTFGCFWPTS
ncbi:MAG TPA: hypothetical protein VL425_10060 [Rudaea sp.]|nr:hypothetical protein [Rudaea sp.]